MSWQKSREGHPIVDDVPELGSKSSVPDHYIAIGEDAHVGQRTEEDKAKSEQEADVVRNTLDPIPRDDDALSIPVTTWAGRTSLHHTAKADISSESDPTSPGASEAADSRDIEQLEQRYIDLQTQAARLYCLWVSDLSPDTRRMRLQQAIETARAHVELARETTISAEQRFEHWRI
ncbi:hypothetical protein KC345_g7942 [Hortaea werneckii]|nr:hypothetical protein KC345_g7942 [Hortaea werneckii]